jgi:hypothetical protein
MYMTTYQERGMAQLSPLISLIFIVPLIAFWLWMFDDMLKNDRLPGLVTNDARLDWMIAFILCNVFAAVVYYAIVYRQRH